MSKFNFQLALKTYPQEGNLVYEYNPFHNYRLTEDMIYFQNTWYPLQGDMEEFTNALTNISGKIVRYNNGKFSYTDESVPGISVVVPINDWSDILPSSVEFPQFYPKGSLVDFNTSELNFSLSNPVNILPQYSYDNSVNLIINDGLNEPRLINSRFSATERNKYQVCNRKGNSNIYNQGEQFNTDISLYKKIVNIPEVKFLGVSYGGNLPIGNYFFYFRYIDEDGNMSDFFAESGLVSVFLGSSANGVRQGFRNENSTKQVRFNINNLDSGYSKVIVYYTRATSDINENATVQTCKIDQEFNITTSQNIYIPITGFEPTTEVTVDEINLMNQKFGAVETQEQVQNRLFFGNLTKQQIAYNDLQDCALRILPFIDDSRQYPIDQIGNYYIGSTSSTYCDPSTIYNYVGYFPDEIYRFGVIFILSDNTLTEVFNIRGTSKLSTTIEGNYTSYDLFKEDNKRLYINYDDQYFTLLNTENQYENVKGVCKFPQQTDLTTIYGINFAIPEEVLNYLQKTLGVKGMIFVRQKRIPTTLCQAYTIGIDNESHTPLLPVNDQFITESFLTKDRLLGGVQQDRILSVNQNSVTNVGALCPEYDVNSPYLNSLFTGTDFVIQNLGSYPLTNVYANLYQMNTNGSSNISSSSSKIIGVEDNVKLVAINDIEFSARAGEAEEAIKFEWAGNENWSKIPNYWDDIDDLEDKLDEVGYESLATNILRGSYGPYLGLSANLPYNTLINIKIPGYSEALMQDYFNIRYNDKSGFYAISDRISFQRMKFITSSVPDSSDPNKNYIIFNKPFYRGDCYICQFTHRMNRNFQDSTSPTNDQIVDPKCWRDHFRIGKDDNIINTAESNQINLGDVNAVKLGLFVTLFVRSTINLNIRAIDDSRPDEVSMFGHGRSFYPQIPRTNPGNNKIPEGLCYNKGFEKSVSEKVYFEVPDVPWIKNEFSNRIAYSEIQIKDAFENGWRTFKGTYYRDYPKTYGSIIKIVELRGNLLCVFEHGVGLIAVNERTVAGDGPGGSAYINTANVLPDNPIILSDMYGSLWRESVIKTPLGVYGVDTVAKKIWRTNGQDFEILSDFYVQEFLNQNISLTERELEPIIGIRNVKTHYNKYKKDVMFTFYDNLHGFNEKVWNLCYNETLGMWVTFYSWVPSYSENIYNQYFSFDRNTSKYIAKLGISKTDNSFSDGVTLEDNVIDQTIYNDQNPNWKTKLSLSNRNLPSGQNITYDIEYEILRDNYGNNNYFGIEKDNNESYLYFKPTDKKKSIVDFCSELFQRRISDVSLEEGIITNLTDSIQYNVWRNYIQNKSNELTYNVVKDDRGRRLNLESRYNDDQIVIYLNIRAHVIAKIKDAESLNYEDDYLSGFNNIMSVDKGYFESTVALIPKYNMQFLTTDFWKHGQAGAIDIADKIYPTYWYGKQHPFEFEFIVADAPQVHKIFDSLEIISNNVEPESFHYEIVGDCYDFAEDKKNMYIRQEATKELYQYNGCDITYAEDYSELGSVHRPLINSEGQEIKGYYSKSTLLPLYYSRQDSVNEIEDSYHLKDDVSTKDFSALAGGEIVHYKTLDEYRIWNHAKAVNMQSKGRLRGNMQYQEDKWKVQINPINVTQSNEPAWDSEDLMNRTSEELSADKIPIELSQAPIPDEVLAKDEITPDDIPENSKDRAIVAWSHTKSTEVKPKDKWIKIRIRYTGDKLSVISLIRTLYSVSYA